MAKKKTATSRHQPIARDQAAELEADTEVQSASERVATAREQLEAAEALLEQAREKAVDRVAWFRERSAGELVDTSLEFVRKYPGLGILTAVSAGFFLGRLFRR